MKTIVSCAVCGSPTEQYPANLDNWVVNRMLSGAIQDLPECKINRCLACNYAGVNYRFTRDEETVYYKDYMKQGSEYVNQRNLDWLARHFDSSEHKTSRRTMAVGVLTKAIDLNQISSMVDFGGNTGDMIPLELNHAQRYVVDVESRTLANGVVSVTSPKESGLVDLVMCSHTLEHVSDIKGTMDAIKSYMKPGSWLYVEVPLEDPQYFKSNYSFHEHINLFTEPSLERLMQISGFECQPVEILDYQSNLQPKSIAIIGQC
jgi:hypothetical protein